MFSVTRESRMLIRVCSCSLSSSWFSDLIPEWTKLEFICPLSSSYGWWNIGYSKDAFLIIFDPSFLSLLRIKFEFISSSLLLFSPCSSNSISFELPFTLSFGEFFYVFDDVFYELFYDKYEDFVCLNNLFPSPDVKLLGPVLKLAFRKGWLSVLVLDLNLLVNELPDPHTKLLSAEF